MRKIKSVIKTITTFFGAIVLVLFFAFLLTYDFSDDVEFKNNLTLNELSNEFYEIIDSSIEEYSDLNIARFNFDDSFINDIASYLLFKNEKSILESDFWTVSGIQIHILKDKIEVELYVKYHNNFNYKLKIKASFTMSESSNSYTLYLRNMKVGSVYITKSKVQEILSINSEGTIGYIYNKAIELLPFGMYNKNDFSYTIYKKEIIDDVESGMISNLINKKASNSNVFLAPIVETLYDNNLLSISLENGNFVILFEYSKFVNDKTFVDKINKSNVTNSVVDNTFNYDIVLASLLGNDKMVISSEELNYMISQEMMGSKSLYESKYLKFYNSGVDIYNDELHIYITLNFLNEYSLFDYIYLSQNDKYVLNRIEIGRDDEENKYSYIVCDYSENKARYAKALYRSSINGSIYNETIDLKSLVSCPKLNIKDAFIKNNKLELEFDDKCLVINEDLMSEEFNNNLIDLNVDYESEDKIMDSFKKMSPSMKNFYFNKIKDYYKDDFSVYNYICNLIE